jgi:predicted O-methyltransferase YrrM
VLHTIEANTQLAPISKNLWQQLGYQIDLKEGLFELVLPELLKHHSYQWVFIDGNHQYEATMHYFHQFMQHMSSASVLVFDDINWSAGMQQAWAEIAADPDVTLCIDLFFLGFVFRNPSFSKETLKLRL